MVLPGSETERLLTDRVCLVNKREFNALRWKNRNNLHGAHL